MTTIDQLNQLLSFRYACKAFDAQKTLAPETKDALLKSLPLTPSSFGMQLWKFFIIEDAEVRQKLKEVSWGQSQVTDSDFHIVFAVETTFDEARIDKWVDHMATVQGTPEEAANGLRGAIKGFTADWSDAKKQEWAKLQSYIALGQFMTSAALLEVDTCPMEGIDHAAYDEILGLKEKGYTTAVACSVGYRSAEDKYASAPKARFAYDEMVEVI